MTVELASSVLRRDVNGGAQGDTIRVFNALAADDESVWFVVAGAKAISIQVTVTGSPTFTLDARGLINDSQSPDQALNGDSILSAPITAAGLYQCTKLPVSHAKLKYDLTSGSGTISVWVIVSY